MNRGAVKYYMKLAAPYATGTIAISVTPGNRPTR